VKKRILAWALGLGARIATRFTTAASPLAAWKLANKLVYSKVREAFGGRVRIFVSGGAPLGIDTARGLLRWESRSGRATA
jgi:long-chain acyl-CoA synthetase